MAAAVAFLLIRNLVGCCPLLCLLWVLLVPVLCGSIVFIAHMTGGCDFPFFASNNLTLVLRFVEKNKTKKLVEFEFEKRTVECDASHIVNSVAVKGCRYSADIGCTWSAFMLHFCQW